jgi:hypothetical protein
MALPRFLLKSTQLQAVTNARASSDYSPGGSANENWRLGFSSMLHSALGLQPSKDVFWSSASQPGCPYAAGAGCLERNPFLQALVATLSTGPVGIGDSIGGTNASLVMMTCRAGDGLLLKPDRPAQLMDLAFRLAAFGGSGAGEASGQRRAEEEEEEENGEAAEQGLRGPVGLPLPELTQAWSAHGPGKAWRWHYILAANLSSAVSLGFQDLGPALAAEQGGFLAFDFFSVRQGSPGAALSSSSAPLLLQLGTAQPSQAAPDSVPLRYLLLAPVLPSGHVLLGECSKLVPMSSLRCVDLEVSAEGFGVTVVGAPGGAEESVGMWVQEPGKGGAREVLCSVVGGQARLTCGAGGCECVAVRGG